MWLSLLCYLPRLAKLQTMNDTAQPWKKILGFLLFFGSCTTLMKGLTKPETSTLIVIIQIAIGIFGLYLYATQVRKKHW